MMMIMNKDGVMTGIITVGSPHGI